MNLMIRLTSATLISLAALLALSLTALRLTPDGQDLEAFSRRGIEYESAGTDLIRLRDRSTGESRIVSLREPDVEAIRTWADTEGVPILEIDPALIDTSLFENWYYPWIDVPVSNSSVPVLIGDLNGNGRPEFYGSFKDFTTDIQTHVYEIDSLGVPQLAFNYEPRPGVARSFVDADQDSLWEITFSLAGVFSDFEQESISELPTTFRFSHDTYRSTVQGVFTGIVFGRLDDDDAIDFLYSGSEEDSASNPSVNTYVAEYNADSTNFVRVWSQNFRSGSELCGYPVSDFDDDASKEFVVSVAEGVSMLWSTL
jgi:hypothetical protein